jgi:Tfp pilus assembly protein PilF
VSRTRASAHKRSRARARARPAVASAQARGLSNPYWVGFALLAGVLIAYAPALNGAFLWDDDAHVTRPELRTLHGLWRIWFDVGATQQYYPLLHSAFWLEHRWWGNSTIGYHLVNVLLHALAAWLLLIILKRLKIPGATLAAGIFALHPVHVESVAWISEQKNTLSLVFYLSAGYAYLRFDEGRRSSWYILASSFFVLGLLTKTVVATLPAALLLVIWWRDGRLSWRRDVMPLVPWVMAGTAAGLVTAWFERHLLAAEGANFAFTFGQRSVLAGRVLWFYAGKLLWPVHLTFVYPRWTVDAIWPPVLFLLAAVAVIAGFWSIRGRSRAPLAAALFFVGSLFPVLGFLNVYPFVFSFVADHFQYLPSIGVIVAIAAGVTVLVQRSGDGVKRLAPAAAVALVGTLGVLTWRHSHDFADPRTLFESTLVRNPACYLCLNNLGTMAYEAGRREEALARFMDALRIKPDSAEAHNNVGNLLVQDGRIQEGISHYEEALKAAPNNVMTRTNLGIALVQAQRVREAKAQFEAVLRIMPDYAPARQNLAAVQTMLARDPGQ